MPNEKFSRESVQAQGEAIKAYWARRGYKVTFSVVPITEGKKKAGSKTTLSGWQLETDMVNGLPAELFGAKVNAERSR